MRKILILLFSLWAIPAFSQICTPSNPVLTLNPAVITTVNGVTKCASGSCLNIAVYINPAWDIRALPIVPSAPINLNGPQVWTTFAKVTMPNGKIAILKYFPGEIGTNGTGEGTAKVCEKFPLNFYIELDGVDYGPQFSDIGNRGKAQFGPNDTFRSTTNVIFMDSSGDSAIFQKLIGYPAEAISWTMEGTFTPGISATHIYGVVPTNTPGLLAVHGKNLSGTVTVNGALTSVKQLISGVLFVGVSPTQKPPYHVCIGNVCGSDIPSIPTTPYTDF